MPQARQELIELSFDDIDDGTRCAAGPDAPPGLIELSFDDIDDGPSEPPSCHGGGVPHAVSVPRTWQSRGGIVLDVAAGPPELAPLAVADGAHLASQPTALA